MTTSSSSPGVDVQGLQIEVADERVGGVLETPSGTARALVLLGHGLSASRESGYLRRIAAQLHERSIATVSMDAPLHGGRRARPAPADFAHWVVAWQGFWRAGGAERMAAEHRALLDACPEPIASLPVGYWGTSLATQTGIPWLAADLRPRAAVLGQFRGDGVLMQRLAPRVRIPVFFIQQQDDELHSAEVSRRLFELIGSDRKLLRSSPGRHAEVPGAVMDESVAWLASQLGSATA